MKKLIALILTLSMLLSLAVIPMGTNAAAIDEAERQEILKSKQNSFISLEANADVDAYASFETIADYARFNTSITGSKDHFATTTYNGATVFEFLPDKTVAGDAITGKEDYYFKGFNTKALVESKKTIPGYVMLADEFFVEDGTKISANLFDVKSSAKPSAIYDGTAKRATITKTVKSSHVVETLTEDGKDYAVVKNFGINHKIGPVDGRVYSPNSVYLSNGDPTIAVNKTGDGLSLLVATGTSKFNTKGYTEADTAIGVKPTAALNKVNVNYADGNTDVKYYITVINTEYQKSDAELSIVYAPKKDNWTAADLYGASKVTAKSLNNDNSAEHGIADVSALTSADITFENPDILMTDSAKLASWINNRQDAADGNYGQNVTMANIPLENKEVVSFKPYKFYNYIKENIPTVIPVGTETDDLRQAFIPVTVKGANPDYDYFAWVGAVTDNSVLLGATVTAPAIQESIDALNEVLKNLDSETLTFEQIEYYKAQIEAIKASNEYVSDRDFDTTALDEAESKYKDQRPLYAPVEMDLLTDFFATKSERGNETNWLDPTSYLAYIGTAKSPDDKIPFNTRDAKTRGGVLSIDANDPASLSSLATMENGRYVLKVGNVPYTLGEMNEGVVDKTAFAPGARVYAREDNLLNSRLDEKYSLSLTSSGEYYTVYGGRYPVEIPTSKINILTTSLQDQSKSTSYVFYAVTAKVTLDTGETVDYVLLTGEGAKNSDINIKDAVLFVPKTANYSSYSEINGAVGNDVKTLTSMPDIDFSDIKLPSAPEVEGTYINKSYLAGMGGEAVGTTRQFYFQNVILPNDAVRMYVDRTYGTYAYGSSFEITAPKGTKIVSVEFIHDAGGSFAYDSKGEPTYAGSIEGLYKEKDATSAKLLIPATVKGVEDYDVYVRATRNCGHSAVLAMTAESTVSDVKEELEVLMENAKNLEDVDKVETMKVFVDDENLSLSDLSQTAREKYDALAKSVDVKAEVSSEITKEKVTVDLTVTNHTKIAGKKFMVVVAFYNANGKLIQAVPKQFKTSAERDIKETVVVTDIPEKTASTQVYVWKDFLSLISLID